MFFSTCDAIEGVLLPSPLFGFLAIVVFSKCRAFHSSLLSLLFLQQFTTIFQLANLQALGVVAAEAVVRFGEHVNVEKGEGGVIRRRDSVAYEFEEILLADLLRAVFLEHSVDLRLLAREHSHMRCLDPGRSGDLHV